MQIHPKNSHLIVQALAEDRSEEGMAIPDGDHDKRPAYGKIIAVPDDSLYALDDIIAFDRYSAFQLEIRGEKFYGVLQERVIAVIDF